MRIVLHTRRSTHIMTEHWQPHINQGKGAFAYSSPSIPAVISAVKKLTYDTLVWLRPPLLGARWWHIKHLKNKNRHFNSLMLKLWESETQKCYMTHWKGAISRQAKEKKLLMHTDFLLISIIRHLIYNLEILRGRNLHLLLLHKAITVKWKLTMQTSSVVKWGLATWI